MAYVAECKMCGKLVTIPCTAEQYRRYRQRNEPIQNIMPDVPREIREVLISGTCPECWIELFGKEPS